MVTKMRVKAPVIIPAIAGPLMIEPKPLPSRHIHRLASLARWSLRLVLGLWLMLAVIWGCSSSGLCRESMSGAPSWNPWPHAVWVYPSPSVRWRRSDGLMPAVELADVVLHDPDSQSKALQLPKVVVAVSARSLMTLGVEQIYVEAPELTVRRNANGVISVAGIALSDSSDSSTDGNADWIFPNPKLPYAMDGWNGWMKCCPPAAGAERGGSGVAQQGLDAFAAAGCHPPQDWGQRFTVMGNFKEPLLSVHSGQTQRWSGQTFLDFSHVDLSQLGHYLSPQDWRLQQGKGSVRAWVDIARGQAVGRWPMWRCRPSS